MHDSPHVLLITADHWPGSFFGVADHPTIQTPTLDQLARNGVRYTQAYSECPICIPARRSLMTGTPPRTHGDRIFKVQEPMPELPTLAQTFRDAGYQAYAVGKLHVYPQRDRIGFDDVILGEEGRPQLGAIDDYDLFLADNGQAGQQFSHGMCNNDYVYRPWHLPERFHVTNWATQQMVRVIKRRDPTRPALWYLSYCHPHPPLAPLQCYLDLYRDIDIDMPHIGAWAENPEALPHTARAIREHWGNLNNAQIRGARRAFYALCTHIDHQLRVVIGTLREEELLDNTIILFTCDHADMLGNHGLWAKRVFYENAANIPMILVGVADDARVGHHRTDDRLVCLQDVMPTLLDLAGIEIPGTIEGMSMVDNEQRDWLYGECDEGTLATRMVRDHRFKLIYYATGNRTQLFDLAEDPHELNDIGNSPDHAAVRQRLTETLLEELYGDDAAWVQGGQLVGLPERAFDPWPDRGLKGQRGLHWPPPPQDPGGQMVGAPPK